ncbi:MAG TPA: Ldh family oxidoreductase [Anaerolineae bacterium]|jgi:ureidoglycolate dehydrogenase (NAD+)
MLNLVQGRISVEDLTSICVNAMQRAGMREADARVTADVLVTTDTWGVYTHGTKQLRPLLRHMRDGGLDSQAHPEVTAEGPGWARLDGHYAMPPFTAVTAMQLAIDKARSAGIAFTGVYHSSHFGAAGYYAMMAARAGLIGIAMTNVDPFMTLPGAVGRVLGTNPITYAVPTGSARPVFLDMATSTVAASKVFAAEHLGKPIPDTWIVDKNGRPSTDPSQLMAGGAMQPMAGYKGYGIALLIEIMAGVLTGASFTTDLKLWIADTDKHIDQGHCFIAIDPQIMMPLAEFTARMDELVRRIKATPTLPGTDRIYLPGEMEWDRRDDALRNGIPLPEDVLANLRAVEQEWNLA